VGARPVTSLRILRRRLNLWVTQQPQVTIAGEQEHAPPVDRDPGSVQLLQGLEVKVPLRLPELGHPPIHCVNTFLDWVHRYSSRSRFTDYNTIRALGYGKEYYPGERHPQRSLQRQRQLSFGSAQGKP